jgi:hypothetical protein
MADSRSRVAVETAERLADGLATGEEVREARARAWEALRAAGTVIAPNPPGPGDEARGCDWPWACEGWAAQAAHCALERQAGGAAYATVVVPSLPCTPRYPDSQRMQRWQADALRCIFGNPFRPVTAAPAWLTLAVRALARGIYEERAFDRLPVLADALEEAFCGEAAVLGHCRNPGPHLRGCWVVDLLLGLSR